MASDVGPVAAASMRDRPIVDIREPEERRSLGWIPGSRPVAARDVGRLTEPSLVVVCQSGRRSAAVVRSLGRSRVHSLAGGMLAWAAASLPVCLPPAAPEPAEGEPLDRRELVRQVRSCFVVEAVVARGDDPRGLDPLGTVDALFGAAGLPTSRADFEARLDRLAEAAWHNEHDLAVIARNVERFYVLGASVAWPTAGSKVARSP
jgi:rhodanese-related sulfurtransferase